MKFKLKRARVTTPRPVSETIDLIVRCTQAIEANIKEGTLAKIAACLSEADAQALKDVLIRAADSLVKAQNTVALAYELAKQGPGSHMGTRGEITLTVNVPDPVSGPEQKA
jgi:hypothetical protein